MVWNKFLNPYGVYRDKIIKKKIATFHGKILDLGCGEGAFIPVLCASGSDVTGVDILKERIEENKVKFAHLKNLKLKVENGETLAFPDNYFDHVVSFDVIEHVTDVDKYLKEIRRVLKPGGTFFLSTPNLKRLAYYIIKLKGKSRTFPHNLGGGHVHLREYTEKTLKEVMQKHGFKLLEINGFFFGVSFHRGKLSIGLKNPHIFKKYSFLWLAEWEK